MANLDPKLLYTKTVWPSEGRREPTERDRAEARELHALYPSCKNDIERAYGLTFPAEASDRRDAAKPAEPSDAPDAHDADSDLRALSSWTRSAGVAPEASTQLRATLADAMALGGEERAAQSRAWADETARHYGDRLDEVLKVARGSVPDALKPIFDRSGIGSRREVVQFFHDLARRGRR